MINDTLQRDLSHEEQQAVTRSTIADMYRYLEEDGVLAWADYNRGLNLEEPVKENAKEDWRGLYLELISEMGSWEIRNPLEFRRNLREFCKKQNQILKSPTYPQL